jgi:predicted RNA methylase
MAQSGVAPEQGIRSSGQNDPECKVSEVKTTSAHQRVVEDYFRTTSSVGSARDAVAFQKSVAGLRRRLGPWLDVAGQDVIDLGSGTGELSRAAPPVSSV